MEKPIVGQDVYVYGGDRKNEGHTCKVSKVGRKYFYVATGWRDTKFFISDWSEVFTHGTATYKLYKTELHFIDECEAIEIKRIIRSIFNYYGNGPDINLVDLRKIKALLPEEKE